MEQLSSSKTAWRFEKQMRTAIAKGSMSWANNHSIAREDGDRHPSYTTHQSRHHSSIKRGGLRSAPIELLRNTRCANRVAILNSKAFAHQHQIPWVRCCRPTEKPPGLRFDLENRIGLSVFFQLHRYRFDLPDVFGIFGNRAIG